MDQLEVDIVLQGDNSVTCDPWSSRNFIREMKTASKECKQCLSDCDLTTYHTTLTSSDLRCSQNYWWIVSIFRSCDSRNLNLSPFCNTSATSLSMWQPSVEETYGNVTTSYIGALEGPMRPKYPGNLAQKELITSLTKVIIGWCNFYATNYISRETKCTTHMRRI